MKLKFLLATNLRPITFEFSFEATMIMSLVYILKYNLYTSKYAYSMTPHDKCISAFFFFSPRHLFLRSIHIK